MEELIMLVQPGKPLPNPGKTMYAPSVLTETVYEINVKKVKKLAWNSNGELLVTIDATRKLKGAENGPKTEGTK